MRFPNYLGETPLGRKVKLHRDAVTQGYGILAKRGKGKSNLLGVMLEIFSSRKQKWVVLDPPDAHWGIRYARDAEGRITNRPSGIEALIIGGPNGDIPIEHTDGKEAARIIVEGNICAVIEMKQMHYTKRQTWCADFAEELFRINETPRFIAFEEAHNFLPQKLQFDEQKRVLYAMGKLIEEGRGIGLGFALVSQRPAKVNKDHLEQIDNLFAMGMIGPRDIGAVKDWLEHHVKSKEILKEIIEKLVKMRPGDAWFLSPEFQEELIEFHVRERTTYHAGRTPKPGERPIKASRLSVPQAAKRLKKMFESKQEERKKEVADLKEAKNKIKELERQLRSRPAETKVKEVRVEVPVGDPKAIQVAVEARDEEWKLRDKALLAEIQHFKDAIKIEAGSLTRIANEKSSSLPLAPGKFKAPKGKKPVQYYAGPTVDHEGPLKAKSTENKIRTITHSPHAISDPPKNWKVGEAKMKILNALAEFEGLGRDKASRAVVAALCGVSPRSSGFRANISGLSVDKMVAYPGGGFLQLTSDGRAFADIPQRPMTTEEMIKKCINRVGGAKGKILKYLHEIAPLDATKEEIAEVVGVSPLSSGFRANVSSLRAQWEMITYPSPGKVKCADWLFIE